jgi:amino acid permease
MVSIFVLISLLGFSTAYVALAKTLIPTALESILGQEALPYFLQNNETGRFCNMTIFTVCIFFPLSLPQKLSSLRFSSALGVICTIILTVVITYQYFFNQVLVPSPVSNL